MRVFECTKCGAAFEQVDPAKTVTAGFLCPACPEGGLRGVCHEVHNAVTRLAIRRELHERAQALDEAMWTIGILQTNMAVQQARHDELLASTRATVAVLQARLLARDPACPGGAP